MVKSQKLRFSVIPAKAGLPSEGGIQYFQRLRNSLDTGFHR
jgi:hypothetical protein